jgi:hypothetical protein
MWWPEGWMWFIIEKLRRNVFKPSIINTEVFSVSGSLVIPANNDANLFFAICNISYSVIAFIPF